MPEKIRHEHGKREDSTLSRKSTGSRRAAAPPKSKELKAEIVEFKHNEETVKIQDLSNEPTDQDPLEEVAEANQPPAAADESDKVADDSEIEKPDEDARASDNGDNLEPRREFTVITPMEEGEFDIKDFPPKVSGYIDVFDAPDLRKLTNDYPVENLHGVLENVKATLSGYEEHTTSCERMLADLRHKMKNVKDNIHYSIQKNTFELRPDDETAGIEERKHTEKLAAQNAEYAKLNSEYADTLRLLSQAEAIASRANIAVARAVEQAIRIEEEIKMKAQRDAERREEERLRLEEEKRLEKEEQDRVEDMKRMKETDRRRRESLLPTSDRIPMFDRWPTHEYEIDPIKHDINVGCMVRGHPTKFRESDVTCEVVNPGVVEFGANEELVSKVIRLVPTSEDYVLKDYIIIAIPHFITRASASSREPIIKALIGGKWDEYPAKEVTFEHHKELKFAQAEVKATTTFAVMSRFKRDYVGMSRRASKVASTVDQRITYNVPRDTFKGKEQIVLQIQPLDTASVNDLKSRNRDVKGLLTASPIISTEWNTTEFAKPITVTVPCPPNPAKAKKIAAMKAAKERKMKQPLARSGLEMMEEQDKSAEREKRRQTQKKTLTERQKQANEPENEDEVKKPPGKWYMGIYGGNDDDENDNLYLMAKMPNGRWSAIPGVDISQVKLDMLQFDLTMPLDRFMVVRVRTNLDQQEAIPIATAIDTYLSHKSAQVVMKQRTDDPFDAMLHIVPPSKVDRTLKKLIEDGYEEGPDVSNDITIREGDLIAIRFRGNVKSTYDTPLEFVFNSNLQSCVQFHVMEVDKYLQKNFDVFRGFVQIFRKTFVKIKNPDGEGQEEYDEKLDLLSEMLINIPKYHVETSTAPIKAPISIHNTLDPLNEEVMRHLAEELGDEWIRLAHYLGISRTRIQAILRNSTVNEDTSEDARYDTLMTWLRKLPKAVDKVSILSSALNRSGRPDLAEEITVQGQDYRQHLKA